MKGSSWSCKAYPGAVEAHPALQIILDLCIPEKELAKNFKVIYDILSRITRFQRNYENQI
jgi:hypothetical protein